MIKPEKSPKIPKFSRKIPKNLPADEGLRRQGGFFNFFDDMGVLAEPSIGKNIIIFSCEYFIRVNYK